MSYSPIEYSEEQGLILLDQRLLPSKEEFFYCKNLEDAYIGIRDMAVRGAPCIGFTAILGLGLWIKNRESFTEEEFFKACEYLKQARPTAVNLAFEVERVKELVCDCLKKSISPYEKVISFGLGEIKDSEKRNRVMAKTAEEDLSKRYGPSRKLKLLTHCNTGHLACGSIGTALGVIQNLGEKNRIEKVWVDETRPYLQGSRLTAYELNKLAIPHNIVVEGAASYLMREGLVDAIFVGADRIVKNGDTANKIGTSNLAIIAAYYKVPFYVVAPSSSFDLSLRDGNLIEIELRNEEEILSYKDLRIAPEESRALNPSFDVTSGELITGIISEKGIVKGNYSDDLWRIVDQ